MKAITASIITVLVVLLTSCTSLKSPHYIGEKIDFSEKEIGKETVWKIDRIAEETGSGGLYHVKIVSSNEVAVATVAWDKRGEKFEIENHEFVVSELGGRQFLSFKNDDLYEVLRMTRSGGMLVLYAPDGDRLKTLNASGRVELNEGSDDNYTLKGSKKEIDQFVLENIDRIFNTDHVLVVQLISGELE